MPEKIGCTPWLKQSIERNQILKDFPSEMLPKDIQQHIHLQITILHMYIHPIVRRIRYSLCKKLFPLYYGIDWDLKISYSVFGVTLAQRTPALRPIRSGRLVQVMVYNIIPFETRRRISDHLLFTAPWNKNQLTVFLSHLHGNHQKARELLAIAWPMIFCNWLQLWLLVLHPSSGKLVPNQVETSSCCKQMGSFSHKNYDYRKKKRMCFTLPSTVDAPEVLFFSFHPSNINPPRMSLSEVRCWLKWGF